MYAGAKILIKGNRIAYNADAKVYHSHSYTLVEEFQRYFDIGVFHKKESWLLNTFGKAEGEGSRYVKSELHYLFLQHAYLKIPEFLIRNFLKYLGYKLGQNYQFLPFNVITKCSMHNTWWEKEQ